MPNAPGASWFLSSKGCGRGRRKRGGSVRQPPPRNETAPCNAPGGANRAEPSVDDDNAEKLAGRPGPAAQGGQFDGVRESAQSWKEAPNPAVRISGGGCLIVGSPLQQQNGIHDTPTWPSRTGSNGEVRRPTRSGPATTSSTRSTISTTGPNASA